jgi:hypothetical protein
MVKRVTLTDEDREKLRKEEDRHRGDEAWSWRSLRDWGVENLGKEISRTAVQRYRPIWTREYASLS